MAKISLQHLILIVITPVFILLSHYLAVYPHEYAHSFMAWFLGYKSNPLALAYGGSSWQNVLFLIHIDENVHYSIIFSQGHGIKAALIAFAGAGIANGSLFIFSFCLLKNKKIKRHPYLYYFLFLFNLMNLGNFYDYVPIRTFAPHGDVANFTAGLHISPWWVYIVGGYLVAILIWQFLTRTLTSAYDVLEIRNTALQPSLMIICVGILFGFFGLPGFFDYGDISYFLSATSLLAIPLLIIALWPRRA